VVKLYAARGGAIVVSSRDGRVKIPRRRWRRLLDSNRGRELFIDVYAADGGGRWRKFQSIRNAIAEAEIDRYLAYRKINICVSWREMGLYERDLETHRERAVLHNSSFYHGCANCHSFLNHHSNHMLLQVRSPDFGAPTLMVRDRDVASVNIRTPLASGKAGFTAWHPSGRVIAFSVNEFTMLYHLAAAEVRDVFDQAGDLALYLVESNQVAGTGKIAQRDRIETFPEWSPDGRYLYFCSAPQMPTEHYREVRCDLMRIRYDMDSGQWGDLETVLTAQGVGGSIAQPRFSPDGRFVLFNVSEYSDFPIHQARCDLHLLDVESGKQRRLAISSPQCDSWHGWSSNGRWIVFSSKRLDGRFSRPFFSYFDKSGEAHRPFVLPQEDPFFYDSLIKTYNIPELLTEPVRTDASDLARAIRGRGASLEAQAVGGAAAGTQEWTEPLPTPQPSGPDPYMPPAGKA
jgi:dipeptidyl aminopeptidase/acylaminoacyl peptidase